MSIIDTLTAGFTTVTKHLWLMAVPVVLDVALWMAPKLSIAPVVQHLATTLTDAVQTLDPAVASDASVTQMLDAFNTTMQQGVGSANLLSSLALGRLGVPSIAGLRQIQPQVDRVIEIGGYGQYLGVQMLLLLVGLLITCLFLGMVAQVVRGEGVSIGKLLKRLPTDWLHMLACLAPLAMALFSVLLSSAILGFLAFLFWAIFLWVVIYLIFVPEAIIMAEQKPLKAVVASLSVVRSSFWPTMGLLILTYLINLGLSLVWDKLLASNVGMAAAILLNAFVGTSFATACFIFFRDRLAALYAAKQQRST